MGYIRGVVSHENQPFAGAVVSVKSLSHQEIKFISGEMGDYVQVGFMGHVDISALNLESRDIGRGGALIASLGGVIALNLEILKSGPILLIFTPGNGAEGVPLNSKIIFIFSEPIDAATFNNQTVLINYNEELLRTHRTSFAQQSWGSRGSLPLALGEPPEASFPKVVSGIFELSADGKRGEFEPYEDFLSGVEVEIMVTTGVKDLQGNPMIGGFGSSFTTVDVEPPVFDPGGITVYMPEAGVVRIRVEENILAVGDILTVL